MNAVKVAARAISHRATTYRRCTDGYDARTRAGCRYYYGAARPAYGLRRNRNALLRGDLILGMIFGSVIVRVAVCPRLWKMIGSYWVPAANAAVHDNVGATPIIGLPMDGGGSRIRKALQPRADRIRVMVARIGALD